MTVEAGVKMALSVQPEVENDPEYRAAWDEKAPVLFHTFEPKEIHIEAAARSSHSDDPPERPSYQDRKHFKRNRTSIRRTTNGLVS